MIKVIFCNLKNSMLHYKLYKFSIYQKFKKLLKISKNILQLNYRKNMKLFKINVSVKTKTLFFNMVSLLFKNLKW